MSEQSFDRWEAYVHEIAGAFPYPPTPDIAGAVRERLAEQSQRRMPGRRLAWAAAAIVIVVVGLLAVPQVRAGLLEVLRIGAVEIRLIEPTSTLTPTPAPSPTATVRPPTATPGTSRTPEPTPTPSTTPTPVPPTATPSLTPTPLTSVLDLAGETTLAEAQEQVDFPIRLPAYPPDLGAPDGVFLQNLGGPAVVLVWLEPGAEDEVRMSLQILTGEIIGTKMQPPVVRRTTVSGERALWVRGPHLLQFEDSSGRMFHETTRLVKGNVLIWMEGEITYRLESDLSLEEAVRVAESLNH